MMKMKTRDYNQQTIMHKIRTYAVQQIRSWETLETVVMLLLIIYMVYLFAVRHYQIGVYSIILFVFFGGLLIFGLYETIPYLIMYFRPYDSKAFGMKADQDAKQRICEEIDASTAPLHRHEMPDMTCTDKYCILEGVRNIEILRWEDIAELKKKEYPFRQKYKGTFILVFIDKDGKKHELDIHNGKSYNPVRQVSSIFTYIMEHHPDIHIELSEVDKTRIEEMLEENRKIRSGSLYS